jgi:hypothetical protein
MFAMKKALRIQKSLKASGKASPRNFIGRLLA